MFLDPQLHLLPHLTGSHLKPPLTQQTMIYLRGWRNLLCLDIPTPMFLLLAHLLRLRLPTLPFISRRVLALTSMQSRRPLRKRSSPRSSNSSQNQFRLAPFPRRSTEPGLPPLNIVTRLFPAHRCPPRKLRPDPAHSLGTTSPLRFLAVSPSLRTITTQNTTNLGRTNHQPPHQYLVLPQLVPREGPHTCPRLLQTTHPHGVHQRNSATSLPTARLRGSITRTQARRCHFRMRACRLEVLMARSQCLQAPTRGRSQVTWGLGGNRPGGSIRIRGRDSLNIFPLHL